MNVYSDIILNSALVASLAPLGTEAGLVAMKSFGGYSMPLAACLATLGAVLGQLCNYTLGRIVVALASKKNEKLNEAAYQRTQHYFNTYGVFLLLFCWIIFGNVLVLAAGFLRTPLKIALPLIAIGTGAHYGMYIL